MTVEVKNVKPITGAGTIQAVFDVVYQDITIKDAKIIQQAGKEAWVAMPSREYKDKDGNRAFAPILIISKDLQKEIQVAALAEWECVKNGVPF